MFRQAARLVPRSRLRRQSPNYGWKLTARPPFAAIVQAPAAAPQRNPMR